MVACLSDLDSYSKARVLSEPGRRILGQKPSEESVVTVELSEDGFGCAVASTVEMSEYGSN